MKMSKYEKETIFFYTEAEPKAGVFTYNVALKRQLAVLCESHPDQVRLTLDNGNGGLNYELPKKWIRISPPRVLSQAQKEVLERMNRKRRESKG